MTPTPLTPYTDAVDVQLRYFLTRIPTIQGGAAVLTLLTLLVVVFVFDRAKWFVLTLMIFMGCLMVSTSPYLDNTLFTPLQQIRTLNRPGALALLAVLLIPTYRATVGFRWRAVTPALFSFLAFEIIISIRYMTSGGLSRGAFGLVVYGATFTVLGVGASRWLQDLRDMHAALRSIVAAGAMIVFSTMCQLAINRWAILDNGRLMGPMDNPQQLGSFLAFCIMIAAYLAACETERKAWRIFSVVFAGVALVMELWTGSRMGILVLGTGLILLFRARLSRLALVGIATGVVVWIAFQMFEGVNSGSDHLFSTVNTRQAIWARLWDSFLASPVWGSGSVATGGESSYLTVASDFGLIGLIPLGIFLGFVFKDFVRLWGLRRQMRDNGFLADLVVALLTAMLVSSIFEGYLIGTITSWIYMFYLALAILGFMVDPVWQSAMPPAPVIEAEYGDSGYGTYGDPGYATQEEYSYTGPPHDPSSIDQGPLLY